MTLVLDIDLDIMKLYTLSENEVCRSMHSEIRSLTRQTDTLTDTTERITTPNSRVAIIAVFFSYITTTCSPCLPLHIVCVNIV